MTFAQAAEEHLDDVYGYLPGSQRPRGPHDLTGETFERALITGQIWAVNVGPVTENATTSI